jgi:hypothetical protein
MTKSPKSEKKEEKLKIEGADGDLVCGACLLDLFSDDNEFLGAPVGCPHLFHWECLTSWAKLQNTCPQCKHRFRMAGKYEANSHKLTDCVKFHKRDRVGRAADDGNDDIDVPIDLCEKCKEPGSDGDLILCDGMDFTCNAMFHYRCVGFDSVPNGLWFCESCLEKGFVPDNVKRGHTKSKEPAGSPKPKKKPRLPSPNPQPFIMPPPNIIPRTLLVQEGANRRSTTSSGIPRNLVVPNFSLPSAPAASADSLSVFARFRQRRLEKKSQQNSL